jgi:Kelch motif/Galactose oxidase, central domain/S-layer homology domain
MNEHVITLPKSAGTIIVAVLALFALTGMQTQWGANAAARPAAPLAYVEKAPEPVATARHSAASSGNLLYIMGGEIANTFNITNTVQRYDPANDTWQFMASMPDVLDNSAACSMSGKIYVPGGWNGNLTNIFYIYDVATNSWTTGASVPSAYTQFATVVCDPSGGSAGIVHRIGGANGNNTINAHYVYDVATNTWTTAADLPAYTEGSQGGLINGHIYVTGGNQFPGPISTTYDYNIATNSWTTRAPMNIGCMFGASGVDPNGRLWVAGGVFCTNGLGATTRTERYDPVANTWTTMDSLNEAVGYTNGGFAGTNGGNALFHVVGGAPFSNPIPNNQQLAVPLEGTPTPTQTPGVPTATVTNTPITPTTTATATSTNTALGTMTVTATATPTGPTVTGTPPSATSTSTATIGTTATSTATSVLATTTGTPPTATTTSVLTSTATTTACSIQFTDVPVGSTFYDNIRCLACRGIINGYPCGGPGEPCDGNNDPYFRPGNPVSRGQLSKIVSNSAGFSDTQPDQLFEDVPVGSTFHDFIGRLAIRGYISGYPCGGPGEPCGPANLPYFRPNNNASRGQISKIDSNAAAFNDTPSGQQFEDVLTGSTYYTYTYRLVTRNIMSGYPCGGAGEPCGPANLPYFRPNNNATRGQTSKIVSNTFFPDCQTP